MTRLAALAVALLAAYLVGSIPSGLWIGRLVKGVDVRQVGSRRTGATNVQRSLGTPLGVTVLVADLMKGFLAVNLVHLATGSDYLAVLGGVAAMVGHIWPVLADFRGGRGVATGGGALLAFSPPALLLTFALMAGVTALTRYVSLGSMVAGLGTALITVALRGHVPQSDAAILMAFAAGSLVLLRHADNLERLRHGREAKLGHKVATAESGPA
ncbi:MAG TPA: glycerol-3-phosphate 1-O-acyltransferase PlsY [Candidatus Dormibacteraeota bacterium]|nr:glycerol-3-phosphate 1-O-acyltransferase PlsY [Candidatus Dormibacteraeota bacterium]